MSEPESEDEAPAVETYEQRRRRMRQEIAESDTEWVRAQKLADHLWQAKLDAEAPIDDGYVEIAGFRERRYRTSCHVGKNDSDYGQH